ncbi:hypothetical protein D9M69_673590 [compost metagenome]
MGANAGELVDHAGTAKNHIVADLTVPGYTNIIGHDDIVADDGIVRHMRAGHDQAIIADLGQHTATFRARIDGHRLANNAAFTDL